MIDFHCHLDLYKDPMTIFEEVKKRNISVLAVTTSPKAYLKTSKYFSGADNVTVALGFHPELVADRINEKELFMRNLRNNRFIGEIGIDGTARNRRTFLAQKEFFVEVMNEVKNSPAKVMSIHSRGAEKDVLQILDGRIGKSIPVLHWFTGSIRELEWAISLGCLFSINPQMCCTKSGKAILEKIPLSKMLPETDGPFTQNKGGTYMPWDTSVVEYLATSLDKTLLSVNDVMQENLNNIRNKITMQ